MLDKKLAPSFMDDIFYPRVKFQYSLEVPSRWLGAAVLLAVQELVAGPPCCAHAWESCLGRGLDHYMCL